MSETKYTYSIADDTKNGVWDKEHLEIDIHNSAKLHRELLSAIEVSGNIELVFHDALPAIEEEYLTYLVSMHDGVVLVAEILKTSTGAQVISQTYNTFTEDASFKGFRIIASGVDVDTLEDYQITSQIYMSGGHFWNKGGQCGDYAEASVVDKDDVLGLFSLYGLVSGVDVLELFKFAETIYLNPDGGGTIYLHTPDSALVYPGLYLRTKIHTTGDLPLCLGITYFWFEE